MEQDAHCFSDSDTEYDIDMRSNPLNEDEAVQGDEGAWAHPYEDMELITPPAKIELREFPVVDLAKEVEAKQKRERKLNSLNGAGGRAQGEGANAAPSLTRLMGKGSWTIKVTQRGGVGRMAHSENSGPDRRVIVPCVDRESPGEVMVGTLGGGRWEFSDVGRSDKRAMSLLWPKEKCGGPAVKGGPKAAKLPDDISEMTPEERLQRERRDEKNRKERERRAQIKLEKQRREAELAAAALAAAAAAAASASAGQVESAAPCGPSVAHSTAPCGPSASSPTTPAPGTPNQMSEAGTPQTVVKADGVHDFVELDAKDSVIGSATAVIPSEPTAANQVPHAVASTSTAVPAARQITTPTSAAYTHVSAPVAAPAKQPIPTHFPMVVPPSVAAAATGVPTTCKVVPNQVVVPDAARPLSITTNPGAAQPSTLSQSSPPEQIASTRQYAGKKLPGQGSLTVHAVSDPEQKRDGLPVPAAVASIPPAQAHITTVAANPAAMLPGKVATPAELPPKAAAHALTIKVATTGPVSPARVSALPPVLKEVSKDGDEAMKENVQDDEMSALSAQAQERGRCAHLEHADDKKALSKRQRPTDLSPVEVNCRGAESKRAVRARGVQRA